MINYTERLTLLMQDVVRRVPRLSFIDMADVLVFARSGRSNAEGAFATCHCLTLPPSEPGYYFWRDRKTQRITRRSEWFVTKSPEVNLGGRNIKYMISFALPRFCDQSLGQSRKERFYPGAEPWMAKLDTVVHELYHIDPELSGIRRIERSDGTYAANCHGVRFFEEVAEMVHTYLATKPPECVYDFLRDDFRRLDSRFGGVMAISFKQSHSFPQRYIERLTDQLPCDVDTDGMVVERLRRSQVLTRFTEEHLRLRPFTRERSRSVAPTKTFRAA
jgi:hypothetical protein